MRLSLPADPDYTGLARVAVSGIALRHGYAYETVEQLRSAIDVSIALLLGANADNSARLVVHYEPDEVGLTVTVTVETDSPVRATPDAEEMNEFRTAMGGLADSLETNLAAGVVRFRTALPATTSNTDSAGSG